MERVNALAESVASLLKYLLDCDGEVTPDCSSSPLSHDFAPYKVEWCDDSRAMLSKAEKHCAAAGLLFRCH